MFSNWLQITYKVVTWFSVIYTNLDIPILSLHAYICVKYTIYRTDTIFIHF